MIALERVLQVIIATCLYSSTCQEQESENAVAEIADYSFCKVPERTKVWRENLPGDGVVVRGCQLDSGVHIAFNSTVRTKDFILKCERDGANGVKLVRTNCLVGNVVLSVGEGKPVGRFFYECTNIDSSCIAYEVSGCADLSGQRVSFGRHFWISHFLYHCQELLGQAVADIVACGSAKERIPVNTTKAVGGYWFSCESRPPKVHYGIVACSAGNGSMIKPGETFRRGEYVYQCTKNDDGTWSIASIRCIANESGLEREYEIGEGWYTTPVGNVSYLMECSRVGDNALSVITACALRNAFNTRKIIEPGCVTQYEDTIFVCHRQSNAAVTGFTIPAEAQRSIQNYSIVYDARLC